MAGNEAKAQSREAPHCMTKLCFLKHLRILAHTPQFFDEADVAPLSCLSAHSKQSAAL